MINRQLQRQIKKYLGNIPIPEEYLRLFDAISRSYNKHERNYLMLDKYIDLGSGKMIELNGQLKAETERLRKAEKEVKTLFENTESVFFSVDLVNYKINQMSDACEKVYGYKPQEFFNNVNLWFEAIHPEDKYMFMGHDDRLATGKPLYYEHRIIHKDKSIHWVEAKVIPSLNERGKLIRIDGIVNDVTEKKDSQQKLLHTEKLLLEAQEMAKLGHWNSNLLTGELVVSETLREMLGIDKGYTPNTASFITQLLPEDKERVSEEIRRLMISGGVLETTYRIIRMVDGQERSIHSVMYGVVNESGKPVRIHGISQDITDRHKAEMKIEQLNMLVYQISHDLRGPINSAKNYIYLALKRVNDRTAQNYLAKIQDAYGQMERRVLSLLDLQRMGRAEIHREPIDISLLLTDVVSSIDMIKGFGEVKIITDLQVPLFECDRQFLHSIFHNLISNAINYRRAIENSYIKIEAIAGKTDLLINLSDNGQGIPEDVLPKLFHKFGKSEASVNGTGLGLYIVKNLVTRLKGEITCTSVVGEGTTFTIRLPFTGIEKKLREAVMA